MKKIFILSIIALAALSFTACKKGFEKENTDPIGITDAPPEKFLTPALVNTLSANLTRNRNFNNELMQVTVTQSEDENAIFRYDFRPNVADLTWNAWYSELTNFKEIFTVASMPEYENDSWKGISLALEAWVFSLLTDSYGDIPFTEANRGKEGIVEPAFDKQKDIYNGLLDKLEKANELLSGNKVIVAAADPVYNGDVSRWRKLANSLHLRLLLRLSGKQETATVMIDKIKEIIGNPSKYPVFTSNDESAVLKWNGTTVPGVALSSPFVTSLREADFNIPSLCNFFIGPLREWNDPRLDLSTKYGNGTRNRIGIAPGSNGFAGVNSGYPVGGGEPKQAFFYSMGASDYSLQKNPLTGIIMTYAELQFIFAEAAAKGWITGDAGTYYHNGIANAINYWVPVFTTDIANAEFTDYVTAANIGWDDALPLDATTGDSKMERIHLQKYYSLFMTDFQQWFEFRRTGHPILPKGEGLFNGGVMPARLNYPVYVQAANPTNYKLAVESMGGDAVSTQVWWQKP
ncbi:SusD/RagB family nutrient-binding outer membrane lipoprotein [Pseudobacter ginsenosidimutans]|uniref:SusD-like starch-binding protein associating with outer membrane n=1 Tax=Pseudobacter ginsenosidimutans TaxID=661488 RepID=A0A4Q7N464_9BACT|nr:SusD/RagB family nutrient-binding outer membrane lipoprotein [Pseudobacter ginsenosidimutans]QEC44310.1 SusD/RagB family nutrient-binding outer membrane lipoprotein [Pseudobacter ginsenosidimutans]RZS75770.1 SusD-like starch-binding protein associating with outer membrane [Pseudobacter ginsenosidimutans]